jgi:hypothetical protein
MLREFEAAGEQGHEDDTAAYAEQSAGHPRGQTTERPDGLVAEFHAWVSSA